MYKPELQRFTIYARYWAFDAGVMEPVAIASSWTQLRERPKGFVPRTASGYDYDDVCEMNDIAHAIVAHVEPPMVYTRMEKRSTLHSVLTKIL